MQDAESQRHLMSGRCPQGCGFDSGQDIILSCIHVIPPAGTIRNQAEKSTGTCPSTKNAKGDRNSLRVEDIKKRCHRLLGPKSTAKKTEKCTIQRDTQ